MKVDLLIRNAWVYRTYRQCFEKMDIAVTGERFYDVSPELSYEAETEVDGTGRYVIPGLVDIHMHVESSMTYPAEFSKTVLPYGVTCVVADPHEIANVFGMEGIRSFMKQETELDLYYGIPSSVPATNCEMETSGSLIGEQEVRELLEDSRVICLGEVMNYKDLVSEEDTLIKRMIRICEENPRKIRIEGHCPSLSGEDLVRFIGAGVDADHTQQTPESVLEKTDQGMFLELQAKSLTREVVETVKKHRLYENIALITDDTMPDHLVNGQLDRIAALAVKQGMAAEQAVYCATFTPARRMELWDRGIIAPGKRADFVIYESREKLEEFRPLEVYKNGKKYEKSAEAAPAAGNCFPDHFYQSVHCRLAVEEDFKLYLKDCGDFSEEEIAESGTVLVHVMEIQSFGTRAKHITKRIPVKDGVICWQEAGLCLAAVFERHGKSGDISFGLVSNGLKSKGAVATTWSHDSHNLLVLGNSPENMVLAQNRVVSMQGGYVTASAGKITAEAGLSVGGIISDERIEVLADKLQKVRTEIEAMGYENNNVIMSISTLTLLVSPELKLSDKGLFDVKTQEKTVLAEKFEG